MFSVEGGACPTFLIDLKRKMKGNVFMFSCNNCINQGNVYICVIHDKNYVGEIKGRLSF